MSLTDLESFYDVNVTKIYRFFFFKVLNREIAEDLTSQCFLTFTKENQLKDIENPKSFLYGIAKYIVLDFLREKYRKMELPLNEDDETFEVENDVPEVHITEHLERVLPLIPVKQALVLRMRFLDKLSLQEIAAKLGKDVNYVSTTQKRGFQSIKNVLSCTDTSTNIVR